MKLYEIQISASTSKVLLEHSQAHCSTYRLQLLLPHYNGRGEPEKPKILTMALSRKFCQSLVQYFIPTVALHWFGTEGV